MEASSACLNLIRVSEGLSLTPYQDAASYWTVGYGHKMNELDPVMGITYQDAERLLLEDVVKAEKAVNELTFEVSLTQGQFDALVDFVYNLGATALAESTLLKRLKAGDLSGAAGEFLRWVHADVGGKVVELDGLMKRRLAERSLFLSGLPLLSA